MNRFRVGVMYMYIVVLLLFMYMYIIVVLLLFISFSVYGVRGPLDNFRVKTYYMLGRRDTLLELGFGPHTEGCGG